MRIGIDASRVNELPRTGTEWYSYHLIQQFKNLIPAKHQVVLYMDRPLAQDLLPLPDNFTCRILAWPPVFLWTQIRLSIEMLFRPPDVLFVPAHTMPLIHPKNTFITLHDVGFERFAHLYSKKPIGPKSGMLKSIISGLTRLLTLGRYNSTELDYHRWSTRFALKKAKKIFTISQFSKSEILDVFGKSCQNKIEIIPVSFDADLFAQKFTPAEVNNVLTKFNINQPYLFFIGRLEEKKNVKGIIEVFNILHQKYQDSLLLVLVGKQGYGYSEIAQKISEYRLNEFIIRPDNPSEMERAILMKSAAVFIFPSYYEGFGIPPLEAMAAGVPVVSANRASIPEVCGSAAILVDPDNHQLLAEKVDQVLNNSDLKDNLVQQGLEQIKKYSWKKSAKQTLDFILPSDN